MRPLSTNLLNVLTQASHGPLRRVNGGWASKTHLFVTMRQARALQERKLLAPVNSSWGSLLVLTAAGRAVFSETPKKRSA
jgi:hypothetical protein